MDNPFPDFKPQQKLTNEIRKKSDNSRMLAEVYLYILSDKWGNQENDQSKLEEQLVTNDISCNLHDSLIHSGESK